MEMYPPQIARRERSAPFPPATEYNINIHTIVKSNLEKFNAPARPCLSIKPKPNPMLVAHGDSNE